MEFNQTNLNAGDVHNHGTPCPSPSPATYYDRLRMAPRCPNCHGTDLRFTAFRAYCDRCNFSSGDRLPAEQAGLQAPVVTDLAACPRCGREHEGLAWQELPHAAENPGEPWRYWATCPETLAPLLMRFRTADGWPCLSPVEDPGSLDHVKDVAVRPVVSDQATKSE